MKCKACRTFYHFFATSLINSTIHKAGKLDSIYHTVKSVLSGHTKIDKTKVLKTDDSLMQVESIAEC